MGRSDLPRSPQGRPAIFQAGKSAAGIEFASTYADVVFSVQATFDESKEFRNTLRAAVQRAGRAPGSVKFLPGYWPFIGSTEREAQALYEELEEITLPAQIAGFLSFFTGIDLSGYGLDERIPELPETGFNGQLGRYQKLRHLIATGHNTLRKLQAAFGATRGHHSTVGTPEQIADDIADWFNRGAADGFNIQAPILPSGLETFTEQVVPILQRRGIFREDYPEESQTLRQSLQG